MLELLRYTVPALLVLLAAWLVLYKLLRDERERRAWELRREVSRQTVQIRLRSYERLALLLERITPEQMLMNMQLQGRSVGEVQRELLQTIRLEFNHNLSQQVYVGLDVWDEIVLAKEEMINFVNMCALQMAEGSDGLEYAQTLVQAYRENGETTVERAMKRLKEEAREVLG